MKSASQKTDPTRHLLDYIYGNYESLNLTILQRGGESENTAAECFPALEIAASLGT